MSTKTYLTTLRLILNEILASLRWQASKARATARAQRDYGSWATRLRLVISMLLMMVLGVSGVKADDISGYYYIASNDGYSSTIANNFYLCPSEGTCSTSDSKHTNPIDVSLFYDTDQPYITTYQTGHVSESIWQLIKVEVDDKIYYRIFHVSSEKYMTHNVTPATAGNYYENRLRVHLQSSLDGDNSLFKVEKVSGKTYYVIEPKEVPDNSLNPAGNNYNHIEGTNDKTVTLNGSKNVGGLIGLWGSTDVRSVWQFENAQCTTPTISFNKVNSEVAIDHEEGETVYYSKNGINPDPNNVGGDNYTQEYNPNEKPTVSDNTIIKALAVKSNMINSEMATKTIVVNPTIIITIPDGGYIYDGSAKSPEVSVEFSGTTLDSNEYEVNYSDNTDAGTAMVNITNVADGNYIVSGSTTFTINKAPLTITANDQTITYGEAPAKSVEYSGFVGTETSDVLSGELEYICDYEQYDDVGSFSITLRGLTSDNYVITFVGGTLTVNPKEVGLEWGTTELPYNGSEQVPSATATGTVNGDEIGVTVIGGQTDVGGGYTATASALTGGKAGNYKLPEANTTEFTINKAPLTVTANDHTITYGDAPAADGVTCSGFINGDNESVLSGTVIYGYNYTQFGDVGDYNITPMGLTATNYVITYASGTLTVNPKEVRLTWGETELTYNGIEQAPTATATGTVNGDEIGVTVEGATNVGNDYTATALALTGDKAANYILPTATEYKTTEFSIGQAPLTVTANDLTITYGDDPAETEADAGVTYTGFVNNESESGLTGTLQYNYHYQQYDDVGTGTYSITPSGLNSDNYAITFEDGTLTVIPKNVRITWGETALTYDGTSKVPTAEITPATGDIVNNDVFDDVVTVTASAKEGSELTDGVAINPGYYKATASFTGTKAGNYKPSPSSLTFSISSKSIGDGNEPADGIDISLTQVGSDIVVNYVKDGETTLEEDKDYTVKTETQGFDYYIIVTGKGNYGGSARKLFVKPEFFKPTGASEYAAVYRASSDLSKPEAEGITPYIVKKVNPSMGTINIAPVDYLPKDVPVLMLANTNIQVFEASSKPDNEEAEDYIPVITAETENSNLLKVAPESGVAVEAAQVYMFYKGEFVLTKKGTITEGKFYLYNPNYKANPDEEEEGGGAGARSVLRFVVGDSTGIVDVEMSENSRTASGNDTWYLLDGRRLSSKPNKQGLYIWNGRKTVINKK